MSNGNNNEFPPGEGAPPDAGGVQEAPLNTGRPAVAAAPGKMVFVIIFAIIFIIIIARSLFFGEKQEVKPQVHNRPEKVTSENAKNQNELTMTAGGGLPQAPSADVINASAAPPPPPPPPPPPILTNPDPNIQAGRPTNEALNKRIHSPLITTGGSPFKANASEQKRRAALAATNDPNAAFAQSVSESAAQHVEATRIPNLNSTIAQGKLIHAVMESAISSDLPGPIRAITSHDTYAESGREVLIPKGSRLIGIYNSSLKRGQGRVFIIWQRVIRPDGIDIQIDSPGVDSLGRAGMGGDVDNKYFEVFSAAFLTSALDVGTAALGDALFGNQQSTTTNNGSGSTTTESPTATAMNTAIQNIGQVGNSVVNGALNLTPTINIDQGVEIVVFVNRDLIFPPELTGHTGFIQ